MADANISKYKNNELVTSRARAVRKQKCWFCKQEFYTEDLSNRLCTPKCRKNWSQTKDHLCFGMEGRYVEH